MYFRLYKDLNKNFWGFFEQALFFQLHLTYNKHFLKREIALCREKNMIYQISNDSGGNLLFAPVYPGPDEGSPGDLSQPTRGPVMAAWGLKAAHRTEGMPTLPSLHPLGQGQSIPSPPPKSTWAPKPTIHNGGQIQTHEN